MSVAPTPPQRRVNLPILLIGLAVAIPFVMLMVVSFGRDPRAVPSVLEGKPAPTFALQTLDGDRTVALADLRGKRVVMNFWSTWCTPCKAEHPVLLAAAERWSDVIFLGVLYQDEPSKARAYLKRAGSSYPHLFDPTGVLSIEYGVSGVPETYFIDEAGVIVHKRVGTVNWDLMTSLLGPPTGGRP